MTNEEINNAYKLSPGHVFSRSLWKARLNETKEQTMQARAFAAMDLNEELCWCGCGQVVEFPNKYVNNAHKQSAYRLRRKRYATT